MNEVKWIAALTGSFVSYMMGGWTQAMVALTFLVVFDYITGFIAAGSKGELASRIGLLGIARKVFIFAIVAIAHQADLLLGDQTIVRDACIYFYLANEILSVIENAGKLGVPIPGILKKAVSAFQTKDGDSH